MLSLGRSLVPSVLLRPVAAAAQPRARPCSGAQQDHRTLYELRTYRLRPHQSSAFLQLTNEKIHLRTAHSPLIGYWSVELGGLNRVFHIWEYDSYAQRAAVRAALARDAAWTSGYLSRALPMLAAQDSEAAYLLPRSRLRSPPREGGAYELETFQVRPGGPAALASHDAPGYGELLGAFHSEFGGLNRVHALWWYESADRRAEARHRAHTGAGAVAAVRNSVGHLDSQRNQLMFPCPFSPMK